MTPIFFNYADATLYYKGKTRLKTDLFNLFRQEGVYIARIDYVFCSDEYLLQLNQRHLQHNTLTDIITFDLSERAGVVGEIYISVERVKENATIHKTSFENELQRVVYHGALHLCGYKDKTPNQKAAMRAKEEKYLKMFHVEH